MAAAAPIARVLAASGDLARALARLPVPAPAAYAYHPWDYAWEGWRDYIHRFGAGAKEILFVGMNPGPFGMAQTGVPFGGAAAVGSWMGLRPRIDRPEQAHPRRPVEGLACRREEVSGQRLWRWAAASFGSAEAFFARAMVVNFCPVCWCDEAGRNLTPVALSPPAWRRFEAPCLAALAAYVAAWRPALVVGIGAFAAAQVARALPCFAGRVGRLLHPSPASPAANRNWAAQASATMATLTGQRWPPAPPPPAAAPAARLLS